MRVFHPTYVHLARMRLSYNYFSAHMRFGFQYGQRAGAICTSVYTIGHAFELKFDIVSSWMWGKLIFLLKNDDMHALNIAPLRPLNL